MLPGKAKAAWRFCLEPGDPVALWTLVIIVAVLGLLVAVLVAGERRWHNAGLDIEGKMPNEAGYRS
jgi:hypothetical protein